MYSFFSLINKVSVFYHIHVKFAWQVNPGQHYSGYVLNGLHVVLEHIQCVLLEKFEQQKN